MTPPLDRRDLLLSAGTGLALAGTSFARPRGAKLRYAAIGCGGMGRSDLSQIAGHPDVEVVALQVQGEVVVGLNLWPAAATFRRSGVGAEPRPLLPRAGAAARLLSLIHI